MLTVLKLVHPGKASMLGAEGYKVKLLRLASKDKRKGDFKDPKKSLASAAQSIDSQIMREEARTTHIMNPILDNINKFINICKNEIVDIGSKKMVNFEKLFKTSNNGNDKKVEIQKKKPLKTMDRENMDTLDGCL